MPRAARSRARQHHVLEVGLLDLNPLLGVRDRDRTRKPDHGRQLLVQKHRVPLGVLIVSVHYTRARIERRCASEPLDANLGSSFKERGGFHAPGYVDDNLRIRAGRHSVGASVGEGQQVRSRVAQAWAAPLARCERGRRAGRGACTAH